ncbi:single-stranded-DNA-specific exonuclease RecJ [Paenibacillus frigoriresistens]|uniref:single-stranded-DNA-specific exonuclease RecJ n=1 Tax=Paenibacillus alginolyticus TaxID=59839 RepID=UPI0015632F0D|nr:single-stranded-DNA-specific exonuclease RecJ [Paenibacillus frigoriresistens]NRF89865.1 single-stranded-DNA-specific exonuclease RecJ [Paenibacillus frigoriresistens]
MFQWEEKKRIINKEKMYYYSRLFNLDPLVLELILDRGFENEDEISSFLFPSFDNFYNPFALNDMSKAVDRIFQAIQRNEQICIFGDYDVDGICSSTLLFQALTSFSANISFRLPLRSEGYGINEIQIKQIAALGTSLIITVDNGSNAHPAFQVAKSIGIDVIVTDHHEILSKHPDVYAFINPMRSDSTYPFQKLCGAGVAFKLVQALLKKIKRDDWKKELWKYVELAAIGTIADVMPLIGENRTIAHLGIQKLNHDPSPVLKRFKGILQYPKIDSTVIAFKIAPMLNASGRVDDANFATKLLLDENVTELELRYFIKMNEMRKEMTAAQLQHAEDRILSDGLGKNAILVVHGDFHEGIIGIIAARLTEKYKKPSIVITASGKGSARSVPETNFSIVEAIGKTSGYLKSFGGHRAAAGLSVDMFQLSKFIEKVQPSIENSEIFNPVSYYDFEMPLAQFTSQLFDNFQCMEPFGEGNRAPIYRATEKFQHVIPFGKQNQHAKLINNEKEALLFGRCSFVINSFNSEFDYLYSSSSKNQFIVKEIRIK